MDNKLVLSYELLYLMQWLLEHEQDKLKRVISTALANGLKESISEGASISDLQTNEDLQYAIVDFLTLLETLLQEAMSEQALKTVMEKKLMPTLEQIDMKGCDRETVQSSVQKTSSRLERNPQANAQEILFNELLKCWKPTKKTTSH